jgi:membrane dipeptidase
LDIGWSAVSFNRDQTLSVADIRRQEEGMTDELARGHNTLTFPELKKARVGVCVATLLARAGPDQAKKTAYKRTDLDFAAQPIAYAQAHGQLAYYRLMEEQGHMRQLKTSGELQNFWKQYSSGENLPLGYILSMEGADPIVSPRQVEAWWKNGLRAVGPAHYGRGQYAYGTHVDGPLSAGGVELLKEFQRVGMILDVTHLSDKSMFQAFDIFSGRILASHHNCRALVPNDRQISDEQIKILIQRDAVIGVALDAWMMYPGWERGKTSPKVVSIAALADHIDHVCQIAGSTKHSAIGSDLDGGFGTEQTPHDLNTISDLQKLNGILSERGYKDADIDGIFYGNWLRFFSEALPK